jgi:hypothetical protein
MHIHIFDNQFLYPLENSNLRHSEFKDMIASMKLEGHLILQQPPVLFLNYFSKGTHVATPWDPRGDDEGYQLKTYYYGQTICPI